MTQAGIVACLCLYLHFVICIAQVSPAQRAALVDLYNVTSGAEWTTAASWLSGDPCDDAWHGVQCDGSHNIVYVHLHCDCSLFDTVHHITALLPCHFICDFVVVIAGLKTPFLQSRAEASMLYFVGFVHLDCLQVPGPT
jgi:hypothetical protein